MNKKFVVGNWKMNCTLRQSEKLAKEIFNGLSEAKNGRVEIVVCPPFTSLPIVKSIFNGPKTQVKLGAQNCHFMPCGAYTGEISPKMVADFCQYVILGHSERRKYFKEDTPLVNRKIDATIENGLRPIVCVGEWKKGEGAKGVFHQVKQVVEALTKEKLKKTIFVYEPVWAISAISGGESADPSYANKIIKQIKEILVINIPVLYGGSVDASNISGFIAQEMLDGVLVGGASIKAKEFLRIIEKMEQMYAK